MIETSVRETIDSTRVCSTKLNCKAGTFRCTFTGLIWTNC